MPHHKVVYQVVAALSWPLQPPAIFKRFMCQPSFVLLLYIPCRITGNSVWTEGGVQLLTTGICHCPPPPPVNVKHLYNICTMLDQRRRRWTDVVQMLYKRFRVCWGPGN